MDNIVTVHLERDGILLRSSK